MQSVSLIDFADGALENIEKYVNYDCYRNGFYANRYWFGYGELIGWYNMEPVRVVEMDWESTLIVITREELFDKLKRAGITSMTLRREMRDENGDVMMEGTRVFTESFEVPIEELPNKEYFGILVVNLS